MAVAQATILARIRENLNETAAKFWTDSAASGLIQWYDEGAFKQHRIVFDSAEKAGLTMTPNHDYLRYFVKSSSAANLVAGTQDYALPTDYWRHVLRVQIGTAPDIRIAEGAPVEDDWKIRTLPHFGPTVDRPRYTVVPSAAATAMLRLYVYGLNSVPNASDAYLIWYYRDIIPTATNLLVDVPDPYNEGPVAYATAQALMKLRHDPGPWFTKFNDCATNIVKPQQSAQVPQTQPVDKVVP